jgi:hydroxymethylglutaryl-CoA lyase
VLENIPSSIKIVEVGPRDGLQNEKKILTTAQKLQFISGLVSSGLEDIEVTSFVRAPKIPQLVDAPELFQMLNDSKLNNKKINFSALVPNLKGMDAAIKSGVKEIAVFSATSDEFNKKNINATVEKSLERIKPVCDLAIGEGIKVRGYISTAFGCPYGGDSSIKSLLKVSEALFKMGVYEISVGDTIGSAHPLLVKEIIKALRSSFDLNRVAMHFHDTKNMAIVNVLTSLEEGITIFDSSAGGLGGCPYAKGASGNVATEDLVYLFEKLGIKTGIDLTKLKVVAGSIKNILKG